MSTEYENIKTEGVLLTRFYGGVDRGVCLQVTKKNSYQADCKQVTLKGASDLVNKLEKAAVNQDEEIYFEIANGFYITVDQCITLIEDVDLFINDSIHKN